MQQFEVNKKIGEELQRQIWIQHGCINSAVSFRHVGRFSPLHRAVVSRSLYVDSSMNKRLEKLQEIINFCCTFLIHETR